MLGNLVGGLTFVGATLYVTHYKTSPARAATTAVATRSSSLESLESPVPAQRQQDECLVG
ncbi:hypothetical protein VT84_11900 [Gemmata sp. SH-PL17]|nr:hypothetical protein [Gemmata sp. SH-PL17]AMV25092.1 hypothetical protein VT84_11900 [Gemmata sp. SH-PL17]